MVPQLGTVQFFDPEKKFGFIRPDNPRSDGRDIFFHRNGGREIREIITGSLDLDFESRIERDPRKGDRVVFQVSDHKKGPYAFVWNYEDAWCLAEFIISERPLPPWPLCRVIREEQESPFRKTTLWEGYWPFLQEIISEGTASFLQNMDEWYHCVWCEERLVDGWRRMWNPLDRSLPTVKDFKLSDETRRLVQRFELARLIDEGEQMRRHEDFGYFFPNVIAPHSSRKWCVNEIGCSLLAKFKDAQKAHDAFCSRLNSLPRGRVRESHASAELLGLPTELVDDVSSAMSRASSHEPGDIARLLRINSQLGIRRRADIDEYKQRAVGMVAGDNA